jgi:hypothetical protein
MQAQQWKRSASSKLEVSPNWNSYSTLSQHLQYGKKHSIHQIARAIISEQNAYTRSACLPCFSHRHERVLANATKTQTAPCEFSREPLKLDFGRNSLKKYLFFWKHRLEPRHRRRADWPTRPAPASRRPPHKHGF